ncbi:Hypothetical_protein [Hexamita inflata]|uniref:Hypothetical_protein n=1 Tax=Hexamita inflata TaxID=28002 RepID=A0AA86QVD6_9EUKA|nr:Hypothetical protein HINF_LOCUS52483 [Hexamita inflata]
MQNNNFKRNLPKNKPLFYVDENIKQSKQSRHRNQKSITNIPIALSVIDENSQSDSDSVPKSCSYSKNLSHNTNNSDSQHIFWDESVVVEVKLLRVSTTEQGKRDIQEIRISTIKQANEMNKQESDIYDLLF